MNAPLRPVLRYHGGKWRIAPWIISYFPRHRVYVEPFGGAGSVLMRKERSYAEIYNDLDGEVVNLFRVLRDPQTAKELAALLELTPWARDEFANSYTTSPDPVEQARRTLVRSTMSFGTTSGRQARTGFRAKVYAPRKNEALTWKELPDQLGAAVERLRGVVIDNRDAHEVMAQHDGQDTLFYCDPPYPISTRTSIRGPWEARDGASRAYRHDMLDDDHRGLANMLRSLKGMVILSGYPCELYDTELYSDWKRVERAVVADGARPRTEVMWMNPACCAALAIVDRQKAKA